MSDFYQTVDSLTSILEIAYMDPRKERNGVRVERAFQAFVKRIG